MNITALKSADTQPRDTSDGQYTVKSPGDGHCIMHSVVNSLNVCAASGVTIYDVMKQLTDEMVRNYYRYIDFIDGNDRVALLNRLSEYINDKLCDTSFGDLVPVILTNALSVNLLIVEKNGVNYDVHFLECNYPKVDHPNTLIIYNIGSHYDSIISIIESIACKSSADYNVVECSTINSPVRDDVKRLNGNCIFKEVKQFYLNNKNNFKIAHINVNSVRQTSLQQYMHKKGNESVNGGDFWKTVKPLISNRGINKDDNLFLSNDGEIVNNPNDLCRMFNSYFTHIANSIGVDDTIYQDDTCESCISDHDNHRSVCQIRNMMKLAHTDETHFSFKTVDVAVIKKHLKNIKINKATGHDLLPPKLLKLWSPILCYPLCFILNMCFTSGMFPDILKQAEICPIFKKGDVMNVCNYRPVSILPNVSKIYEKENVRQLENYFENLLSPYISGFRKTHSCETVLIRMVEHIKKSLDHGKIVCAVLMDLSKAFDCISHKLLIAKFRSYGLSMSACHLLTSYLRDRTQRVKIGNTKSTWLHIL